VNTYRINIEKNRQRAEEIFQLLTKSVEETNNKIDKNMKECLEKFDTMNKLIEKNKED
jgi:transcription termination factor NusB